MKRILRLDKFSFRQFDDPNYSGTRIKYDKKEFEQSVNKYWADHGKQLVEGYAPFCKHVFIPNFCESKVGFVEITPANEHLLRSGYFKRREEELPVLERYFPKEFFKDSDIAVAKFLDLILYSRDQCIAEAKAMNENVDGADENDWEWAIVAIKAQNEEFETPMSPITILRNALGKEEGGSGVPLDRTKYLASVAYWEKHAILK